METLRPGGYNNIHKSNENNMIFEEIEEEIPEEPVYIEANNPEEAYHKFLLAEQSNFEQALQKQAENDMAEDANDREDNKGYDVENMDHFVESIDNFERTTRIPTTMNNDEGEEGDGETEEHYPEGTGLRQAESLFRRSVDDGDAVIRPAVERQPSVQSERQRQYRDSVSENSEIARIQGMKDEDDDEGDDGKVEDENKNFLESQQFSLGKGSPTKHNMQLEKSMEFDQGQDFFTNSQDHKAQMNMYAKTLRASSTEPPRTKSRSPSIKSIQRVASSSDFQKTTLFKRAPNILMSSSSNFALTSTNDFKFMGDQFKVGKFNPNLSSTCEQHFQKLCSKRLSYLYKNTSRSMIPEVTNDNKFTGMQFRMGKFASPVVASTCPTYEQRFQATFKSKLEVLKPKAKPRSLTFAELKQLHVNLLPVRPY